MRVVYWGTYDTGKPRNRILLRGLREQGVEVIECHATVWAGVEDKSQIAGWPARCRFLLRWLLRYPALIARYLALPAHDAVIVGYLGHLDVLVLWPFARLRSAPVAWDAFLSLYGTVVEDRKLVGPRHPLAWLLWAWEWLACRAARWVILDTRAHADYFRRRYRPPEGRLAAVPVGAEPEAFPPRPTPDREGEFTVLFYGQFIPLHGVATIIEAARLLRDEPVRWVLIGRGQEEKKVTAMLEEEPLPRLRRLPWVPYKDLAGWIHRADVCLGIFGESDKAARVIPNKAFQVLMTDTPLITRDSPAVRELVPPDTPGIHLVPPADPAALAAKVRELAARVSAGHHPERPGLRAAILPAAVGRAFRSLLECGPDPIAHASGSCVADLHEAPACTSTLPTGCVPPSTDGCRPRATCSADTAS